MHRHGGRRACVLAERRGRGMVRARGGRLRREVRARGGVRRGGERTRKVPRVVDGGQQQRARGWRRRVLRAWQATWAFAEGEGVARDAAFATDVAVLVSPGGPGGQPARLVNALGEGGAGAARRGNSSRFRASASRPAPRPRPSVARVHLNGARCVAIHPELLSPRVPGRRLVFPVLLRRRARDLGVGTCLVVARRRTPPTRSSPPRFSSSRARSSSPLGARGRARSSPLVTARTRGAGYGAVRRVPSRRPRARRRRFSPARPRRRRTATGWWCDRTATTVFVFSRAPSGALSLAIAVGRDGRDAAVGRDRVVEPRRPAASAPSLATLIPHSTSLATSSADPRLERLEFERRVRRVRRVADDADALVAVALSELELGDVLGRGAYGVVRRGV